MNLYMFLDKYQYEEWREHPEMVPRGSNYYEVRDEQSFALDVFTDPSLFAIFNNII